MQLGYSVEFNCDGPVGHSEAVQARKLTSASEGSTVVRRITGLWVCWDSCTGKEAPIINMFEQLFWSGAHHFECTMRGEFDDTHQEKQGL